MSSATDVRARRRDALAQRLREGVLGTIDVHTVYIGDRLGLYRELAKAEATAGELAARTRTIERYVREWLEQQAVTGLLEVDDPAAPAGERRYRLPPGHAEVLVDRDDLAYSSALARMMVGMVRPLPRVLEAFRSGAGVPYAGYDADFCDGQGGMNRVPAISDDLLHRDRADLLEQPERAPVPVALGRSCRRPGGGYTSQSSSFDRSPPGPARGRSRGRRRHRA